MHIPSLRAYKKLVVVFGAMGMTRSSEVFFLEEGLGKLWYRVVEGKLQADMARHLGLPCVAYRYLENLEKLTRVDWPWTNLMAKRR